MSEIKRKKDWAFTLNVKNNLNKYMKNIENTCGLVLNPEKLTESLKHMGIDVSKGTVEAIFKEGEERGIQLEVLAGICEILGINIADLLPRMNTDASSKYRNKIWDRKSVTAEGLRALPPKFYEGRYHCYYFRPTYMYDQVENGKSETETQPILHAILELKYEDGCTKAYFKEIETQLAFDGKSHQHELQLEGNAHLLIHLNQVHISLTDQRGIRLMNIMFPYIHLAKDILYSQIAGVFNISREHYRHPLFQKMALFREELDLTNPNVSSIVRGIISMSCNEIIVEKDKFDKLASEEPIIVKFPRKQSEYYVLYEDMIYASIPMIENLTYTETVEYLMKMRNISTSPAIYTVKEHERYNIFSKALQKGEVK